MISGGRAAEGRGGLKRPETPWGGRPWGDQLGAWFLETAGKLGVAAVKALPDLAVVFLIYLATRWLLKLVSMLFTAIEEGRIEVTETLKETTQPTRRIVSVVFWIFALIMAYPYLPGSGSEAFKGVGVMVGLMVSIGSSALIGQLASGFMIMYSRTLKVCAYLEDALTRVPTLTALHSNILDVFNEYGVQITSPNYEADPGAPKVVPRDQWFAAPARRRPEGNDQG